MVRGGYRGQIFSNYIFDARILGRAEAFASKNSVRLSIADGIGMGLGFTLGLTILGLCREILGAGTITVFAQSGLQWQIMDSSKSMILMILAPGGFLALGCILGLMNWIQALLAHAKGNIFAPPQHLDCRHCMICKWGE